MHAPAATCILTSLPHRHGLELSSPVEKGYRGCPRQKQEPTKTKALEGNLRKHLSVSLTDLYREAYDNDARRLFVRSPPPPVLNIP